MNNPTRYVPILKWKRAEESALKNLDDAQKEFMTPLVELVMPKPKLYKDKEKKIKKTDEEIFNELIHIFKQERIAKIPEEIVKSWGHNPIYIDYSLLYTVQLKKESIEKISALGSQLGLTLIPVINLSDDEEIKKTVALYAKKGSGLCLRIVSSDFTSIEKLNEKIDIFIRTFGLTKANIDLLIDLKNIKEIDGSYQKFIGLSQKINNLMEWRNFIFASGAFPEDLSKCNLDDSNLIPRFDWLNWNSQIKSGKLKRNPTFADYTIRHPIYNESFQFFAPTTSIKYTRENDWLIMKGKKQKFELYLANAKLLSTDTDIYYGENFSFGDKYIAEKGRYYDKYIKNPKIHGTGSTETWITAGINHHLVCTISQIANLI